MREPLYSRGVRPNKLRQLSDVLWEWITLHERYGRSHSWNDVAWWYNERASVSVFAGAAWRIGAIAFEEYYTPTLSKTSKSTRQGRQDLYFRIGRSKFVAEAKHIWLRLPSDEVLIDTKIKNALGQAMRDALKKRSFGAARLAIVFVSPQLARRSVQRLDERMAVWTDYLRRFRRGAVAWVHPLEAEFFPLEARVERKYQHAVRPGCAVFVVRVRQRISRKDDA